MIQEKIITEEDLIDPQDIITRALELNGLSVGQVNSDTTTFSQPITRYSIDSNLRSFLEEREFRFRPSDHGLHLINTQAHGDIGWRFDPNARELFLSPIVRIQIMQQERGVMVYPDIGGSLKASCMHEYSNYRLFLALTEYDQQSSDLSRRVVVNEGRLLIPWQELGLAGIRTVQELFNELFRNRELVESLARIYHLSPFRPHIYSPDQFEHPERKFIEEALQGTLLRQWRTQLEKFKQGLSVN
ncbi:hypothetical protein HY386_01625 [Candidatus Daviesbacteria bacterium]|nr:hypothetical protein [Candidatus Daviesbacteria bacterium]